MTEYSYLWTTNGTGDGTATGYADTAWLNIMKVVAACAGKEGVAPMSTLTSLSNNCAGGGGAGILTVGEGGAMVDGRPYYNSALTSLPISYASAGNTRIDRVVLRADWSAQTVRATRIEGTETTGTPTAPSITQTSGVTYDIPICQALIGPSSVLKVTDERVWAVEGMALIESWTGTGATGTKTFSGIPQGFSKLFIEYYIDTSANLAMLFNGISSGTYTNLYTEVLTSTGALSSGYTTTDVELYAANVSSASSSQRIEINGYTKNRSHMTSIYYLGAYAYTRHGFTSGQTTPLTSLTITLSTGNFSTNSYIKLYGVK